jgi:hypothetical protein
MANYTCNVGLSRVKIVHNLCIVGSHDLLNVVVKRIIGTDITNIPDKEVVMILD